DGRRERRSGPRRTEAIIIMGEPRMIVVRRSGMRRVIGVLALLMAAGLVGCGDSSGSGGAAPGWPVGRTFLSTKVTEKGQDRRLVAGTRISVRVQGPDALLVQGGCNTMNVTVSVEAARFTVTSLAMTAMGCPDGRSGQDTWLAGVLNAGPAWLVSGN